MRPTGELAAVLFEAEAALARREVPVLATVVATRGSAYRRPGARMLVSDSRWLAGSISGGCLEADVVRRSGWLAQHQSPLLRTYDTSGDGDIALGCGGEVDVVLEPLCSSSAILRALTQVVLHRVPADVELMGFKQTLLPSPRLVIVGGGHDVAPVAAFAAWLGWDLHVADWRQLTRIEAVVHRLTPSQLHALPLERGCAVLIMSHHLLYDEAALKAALASDLPGYIGVLGPRHRTDGLLEGCGAVDLSRVHAPVGFDLGGEGPAAVALSIAAQVQSFFSRRDPARVLQPKGAVAR
jgi:xanthine/CO dehydrogenase XdhC/CoxF family maturation factor